MRKMVSSALFLWLAVAPPHATRKPHVVSLGKRQTVKWFADVPVPKLTNPNNLPDANTKNIDTKGVDLKIRPLSAWIPNSWIPNSKRTPQAYRTRSRTAFSWSAAPPGLTIAFQAKRPTNRAGVGNWAARSRSIGSAGESLRSICLNLAPPTPPPPGTATTRGIAASLTMGSSNTPWWRYQADAAACEGSYG
jgi:hypothetical protein